MTAPLPPMYPVDAGAPSPLLAQVRQLIDAARQRVASAVNAELTQLYWQIERRNSAELLQRQRGEYGKQVVAELARQLTAGLGKGCGERQLRYCVRVAEVFPEAEILHTLCSELSWSHLQRTEPCKPLSPIADPNQNTRLYLLNKRRKLSFLTPGRPSVSEHASS